jgi:hypothetical protein
MHRATPFLHRVAFAIGVALGGCSLLDPLDDISNGQPQRADSGVGKDSGRDTSGSNDLDPTTTDAGHDADVESGSSCVAEVEPNDTESTASPLPLGEVCGVMTGDEADVYTFSTSASGELKLDLIADDPLTFTGTINGAFPLSFNGGVGNPYKASIANSGSVTSGFITVHRGTATKASAPYRLVRSGT